MAGFIPEHDDFAEIVYRISNQAARIFQDAETRLLAEIARRLIRELPDLPDLSEQLRIVQGLEQFARELTSGLTRETAEEIVARAAREGAASVIQLPEFSPITSLAQQHVLAATLTAFDLGNKFEDMRARILRYPRDAMGEYIIGGDVFQQVIANNVGQVMLGAPKAQARRAALQEFLERGVTGFTDIAGRNWRIGTYAEMATRTAVTRAFADAKVARAAAVGIDLFSVIGGRNACDHCAPWFGKIIAATGGAGSRVVEHAFRDEAIVVVVAGSIADWRASGANHPNCTCTLVEYLPGFPVPTAASGYDPEAHAARDRLRDLERRERDAKRKLEIATAAGDTEKANTQQRRILALQKETREHVAATGQRRRYERAQVRFADGRRSGMTSPRPGEVVVPRVLPRDRVAPFIPQGVPTWPHELPTADRLADVGMRVRFRPLDNSPGAKNIDITIGGELWEMKSPTGSGSSVISRQLRHAKEQGATRVVIDMARTPLGDAAVLDELRRRFSSSDWLEGVIHIAHDGTVTRLFRP